MTAAASTAATTASSAVTTTASSAVTPMAATSAAIRRIGVRVGVRRDEGAYTLLVIVFVFALFLMVGLSVDGGGRLMTQARADDIAAEAARAAGQAIDLPQAISGTADVVNQDAAQAAAQAYLTQAGVTGLTQVINGGKAVRVTVHIVYRPVILGAFHFGPWTQTGVATAQLLTG